jgi:hypothetical protein
VDETAPHLLAPGREQVGEQPVELGRERGVGHAGHLLDHPDGIDDDVGPAFLQHRRDPVPVEHVDAGHQSVGEPFDEGVRQAGEGADRAVDLDAGSRGQLVHQSMTQRA